MVFDGAYDRCAKFPRLTSNGALVNGCENEITRITTGTSVTPNIRNEINSLGEVEVPADKLWGAQTQRSLLSTLRPVVLTGQILGALLCEFTSAQSRGLTDFDQVAIGVPHVTANLSTAINRRRHKLGPF